MSKRDPSLLIGDILESAQKILDYTHTLTREDFVNDSKTIDAVARNFEIIGEAASRLPLEFRESHPAIEWRRIVGLRNRIVHDYFGIDYQVVWEIKSTYLPKLIEALQQI
jgi:uncharacterized protein with HEPN domain